MKTAAHSILLLILATAANADDSLILNYCRAQGERAAMITQARQDGESYIETLKRFQDMPALTEYVYRRPILPIDALADIEVQEIRAAVEMACLQQGD